MFRWLYIFLLACTPLAHAAPEAGAPDEVERFVTDKGLLNRLEGLPHAQIAAELGVSLATVERWIKRTLTHLYLARLQEAP